MDHSVWRNHYGKLGARSDWNNRVSALFCRPGRELPRDPTPRLAVQVECSKANRVGAGVEDVISTARGAAGAGARLPSCYGVIRRITTRVVRKMHASASGIVSHYDGGVIREECPSSDRVAVHLDGPAVARLQPSAQAGASST